MKCFTLQRWDGLTTEPSVYWCRLFVLPTEGGVWRSPEAVCKGVGVLKDCWETSRVNINCAYRKGLRACARLYVPAGWWWWRFSNGRQWMFNTTVNCQVILHRCKCGCRQSVVYRTGINPNPRFSIGKKKSWNIDFVKITDLQADWCLATWQTALVQLLMPNGLFERKCDQAIFLRVKIFYLQAFFQITVWTQKHKRALFNFLFNN